MQWVVCLDEANNDVVSCIVSDLSTFRNSDACYFHLDFWTTLWPRCIIDFVQDSGQSLAHRLTIARTRFLTILKNLRFDRK